MKKIPAHTNKINHYLQQGMHGATWYNNTRAALEKVYGEDTDIFIDFLAVTSVNTSLKANISLAKKAYQQWRDGGIFSGFLPVVEGNLYQVVVNHDYPHYAQPIGGRKVCKFADALHGDPRAIVVDRWMLRAFGFDWRNGMTPLRYRMIEEWIEKHAEKLDMQPREVQAAIWCGIKKLKGDPQYTSKTFEELL